MDVELVPFVEAEEEARDVWVLKRFRTRKWFRSWKRMRKREVCGPGSRSWRGYRSERCVDAEAVPNAKVVLSADAEVRYVWKRKRLRAWIRKRFRACQRFRMQVLMLEMRGCGSGSGRKSGSERGCGSEICVETEAVARVDAEAVSSAPEASDAGIDARDAWMRKRLR